MMLRMLRWLFRRSSDAAAQSSERSLEAKRLSREVVTAIMDRQVQRARGNPALLAKMEAARAMTLEHWAAEDRAHSQ